MEEVGDGIEEARGEEKPRARRRNE